MKDKIKTYSLIVIFALLAGGLFGLQMAGAQIQDVSDFTGIKIKATALTTATPLLEVYNQGSSQSVVVRDSAGTPVFTVDEDGGVTSANTLASGTLNNVIVSQPTAATTATPAAIINSAAAGSNLLEVQDATTPVFVIENGGAVTGFVVGSATSGQNLICSSQSITAAATVVHGMATPVAAVCTLAADPTGNQYCTYTNSAGVVTVKVWQDVGDATPVANSDAVSVSWCVLGTP